MIGVVILVVLALMAYIGVLRALHLWFCGLRFDDERTPRVHDELRANGKPKSQWETPRVRRLGRGAPKEQ